MLTRPVIQKGQIEIIMMYRHNEKKSHQIQEAYRERKLSSSTICAI